MIRIGRAMQAIALATTNQGHWVDMGGTPYLTKAGCEALCSRFGISTKIMSSAAEILSDDQGEYRVWEVRVKASVRHPLTRQIMEAERTGTGSTKDPFFGMKNGKRLPLSEINMANVRKKAETNAMNRAIKAILGFSPTWDELKVAFGKQSQNIAAVEYKGKSAQKSTGKGVLDERKKEIARMIFEMAHNDQELSRNMLESYTEFVSKKDGKKVPGVRDVRELTDARAKVTHQRVKREYDQHLQEQAGQTREPGEEG
jgi:hypothetical protein